MLKSWKLLLLLILLLPGVALIIYLFFRENVKNLGDNLTGNKVEIPVEGEPTQSTLLESLFNSPIDFDGQMAKIRESGFENEYFTAFITKVKKSQKTFTLKMEFPVGDGFETEEKIASVNCPVESTAVLGVDNLEVLAEDEDIFKWAEVNDRIISYCLDSNCGTIGKECILIKTSDLD